MRGDVDQMALITAGAWLLFVAFVALAGAIDCAGGW